MSTSVLAVIGVLPVGWGAVPVPDAGTAPVLTCEDVVGTGLLRAARSLARWLLPVPAGAGHRLVVERRDGGDDAGAGAAGAVPRVAVAWPSTAAVVTLPLGAPLLPALRQVVHGGVPGQVRGQLVHHVHALQGVDLHVPLRRDRGLVPHQRAGQQQVLAQPVGL